MGERSSLTAQDPTLRHDTNPYFMLQKATPPPAVSLYQSGQPGDGYEAGLALKKEAKAPTVVHVVYIPKKVGGHNMKLWKPQVVPAFQWLTVQMGLTNVKGDDAGGTTGSTEASGSAGATGTGTGAAGTRGTTPLEQ
jgi:hypothetical protein